MSDRAWTPIATVLALLGLAACSTVPAGEARSPTVRNGEVGVEDLTAMLASSARLTLAENENFLPALPEPGNRAPEYPAALLAQGLPPQVVCLRVSVSEEGVVSSAPFAQAPDCSGPDAPMPPFVAAAQAAVAA